MRLSNVDNGIVRPTIQVLAKQLGMRLLHLVFFTEDGEHQKLLDPTRFLPKATARRFVKEPEDQGFGARSQEPNGRYQRTCMPIMRYPNIGDCSAVLRNDVLLTTTLRRLDG